MSITTTLTRVYDGGIALQNRHRGRGVGVRLLRAGITVATLLAVAVIALAWVVFGLFALSAIVLFYWLPLFLLSWLASATGYQVAVRRR